MTEVGSTTKMRWRISWPVFIGGVILVILGIIAMTIPVYQHVSFYIPFTGKDYSMDIPTYPFSILGIILVIIGTLLLVASLFVGEKKQTLER